MKALREALALLLLIPGATAILVDTAPGNKTLNLAKDTSSLKSTSGNIPADINQLQQIYDRLVAQDKLVNGSYPVAANAGKVKMLVGVFTTIGKGLWADHDRQADVRRILRSTWMDHPDVCIFPDFAAGCSIHVVFVACQGENPKSRSASLKVWFDAQGHEHSHAGKGAQEFKRSERDVLLMNIEENMNDGKTFEWFKLASRFFPHMDYIGKADTDVFIHVNQVINHIQTASQLRDTHVRVLEEQVPTPNRCENHGDAFLGKPWTCLASRSCPPRECGPPVGTNFMAFNHTDSDVGDCFTYMQGGFYAMTASMARNITKDGGFFQRHMVGPEDLHTGMAVAEYAHRTGHCVSIWSKELIQHDNMYHHLRGRDEHPGAVSYAWDAYYDKSPSKRGGRRKWRPLRRAAARWRGRRGGA